MLTIIDNYDSFTYNLVQYFGELYNGPISIHRNDSIDVDEIKEMGPSAIVISPGPCTPKEAGVSVDVIKELGKKVPVLGVCLGHQSIGYAFGGKVIRAPYLMHGKVSSVFHNQRGIYAGIPSPFTATRYHSLIVEKKSCPDCLNIVSSTEDGIIMGFEHKTYPIFGVQYHPESILTEHGKTLLGNFLTLAGLEISKRAEVI
ncbi:aminodeoxychorismate/anthranilate synthase component II [Chitinispirillales bacterium ANBcel5]|uniref:anthranilate synthase component II n=1 Tax=Cellulosispirillum alkaliphilum TaxID=3039283 RepID=UPI002A4E7FF1|nr:aminodeoxychorismate/anthranilate synthase component II [Chitinispirillales bacterium ANBcel5]